MKYKELSAETRGRFKVVGLSMYLLERESPTHARVVRLIGEFPENTRLGLYGPGESMPVSPDAEIEMVAAA